MTYRVDPVQGDDTNPAGKPWKTYGKLNTMKLAPGDKVLIAPGRQDERISHLTPSIPVRCCHQERILPGN